jgi:hypothetical protein
MLILAYLIKMTYYPHGNFRRIYPTTISMPYIKTMFHLFFLDPANKRHISLKSIIKISISWVTKQLNLLSVFFFLVNLSAWLVREYRISCTRDSACTRRVLICMRKRNAVYRLTTAPATPARH